MSKTYNSSNKCCGTCANWGGERTVQYNAYAIVDSPSARGKCYENVFCGVTQGPCSCEGTSCSKYQKWSALR